MENNSLPVLYSFRRCPYAMRARLGLVAAGVQVELREVVLRDKPEELRAVSEKATVPVLVLPDAAVLDESFDILLWALGRDDPRGFLNVDQNELRSLVSDNDGDFKKNLDGYKYPDWNELSREEYREGALPYLKSLNARLTGQKYLGGDNATALDIAVMPFVRQFAAIDREWFDGSGLDDLRNWLDDWLASELFQSVMPKYPQWRAGDPRTVFP